MNPEIDVTKPLELVDGTPVLFKYLDDVDCIHVEIASRPYGANGFIKRVFTRDGHHYFYELPDLRNVPVFAEEDKPMLELSDEQLAKAYREIEPVLKKYFDELIARGYTLVDADGSTPNDFQLMVRIFKNTTTDL